MKKIIFLFLVFIILVSGCISNNGGNGQTVYLDYGDVLPDGLCRSNNFDTRIIVMHKTGCSACEQALPVLESLEKKLNLTFEYYDLAEKDDLEKIKKMEILPQYVPTVLIKCKAYGLLSEQEYEELIGG